MGYFYCLGVQIAYKASAHFPLAKTQSCGSNLAAREAGKCSFPVCTGSVFPPHHTLLRLSLGVFYKVQYGLL